MFVQNKQLRLEKIVPYNKVISNIDYKIVKMQQPGLL